MMIGNFYYLHVHERWLNPGSFDRMTKYKTICYHYIFGNTVGNMMLAHTQLYQPHVGMNATTSRYSFIPTWLHKTQSRFLCR